MRAKIQQIIEFWWPFWIMQSMWFPVLGFLRTFSIVFWGRQGKSLWQQKNSNLFQVKPYFAWTTTASSTTYLQHAIIAIWIHYTTATNSHLQHVSHEQT